jgi:hypothetical protein
MSEDSSSTDASIVLCNNILLYLSLVSTSAVIIYFLLKPRKRLGHVGARFMFSVICSGFLYAAGFIINNYTYSSTCPAFAIMFVFGTHAVGTWTCAIALYIFFVASMKISPPEKYFHIFAWGIPSLLTFIPAAVGVIAIQETDYCFVATDDLIYLLYLPIVLYFIFNTVLLGVTIHKLRSTNPSLQEFSKTKAMQLKLLLLQINFS